MRYRVLYTAPWYPTKNRVLAPFIQKHAKADSLLNDVAVLAVVCSGSPLIPRIRIELGEQSESVSEVIVHAPSLDLSTPKWLRPLAIVERAVAYLWGYHYIKRYVWKGGRPDVCHVNVLTEAAALPWLLKKFCGIPYIISEHWSRYGRTDGQYPLNRFHSYVTRLFVSDAYSVCPVSHNLELAMKKHGLTNRRFRLIGNVVDTSVFYPSEEKPAGNPYRFCHISWLRDKSKNVSGILRSLYELDKTEKGWEMTIVGDGNDRKKLEMLCEELGLSDKVRFVGAYQGSLLADILRRTDCLVMFSNYENQPVVILEALACGLPVISTAVGDVPNMLACGRGVCVDKADQEQLADKLLDAIRCNWKTDAEASYSFVADNFSREVIAEKFQGQYTSAIQEGKV